MDTSPEAAAVEGEGIEPSPPQLNRKQKRDLFRQVADRKTRKRVFGKWRTRTEWKWEGK